MPDPVARQSFSLNRFLFRHRGLVPVPLIVFALVAADPTPARMVTGLLMMGLGEGIRLWATAHLGLVARSKGAKVIKLVTRGPFAHTRHPLYWGNFLLVLGFALATGAGFPWFPSLAGVGFLLLYRGHARREEVALAGAFPEAHAEYCSQVPGLLWAISARSAPDQGDVGEPSLRQALRVEALTLNAEFWLLIALWIRIELFPAGTPWAP